MDSKTVLLGVVALVVTAALAFTLFPSAPAYVSDKSPVMYFYSAQCRFCQQQKPVLEELAAEGYRVRLMDVGKSPQYWQQYGIEGTPAFATASGVKVEGLQDKAALRAWLDANGAKVA